MSARADRLAARVAGRGLDLLLVSNLVDVRYLTGFTGSNAAALIGADQRTFFTDFRYLTQSAEEVPEAFDRRIAAADLLAGVARAVPEPGPLRLGFDDVHMPVKARDHLRELVRGEVELVAAGGLVAELRVVKDEAEIEKVRAAAQLADEALREVLDRGLAGRTERDVALDLEFAMRRLGAEAVAFAPIVAAGPHGALPHAQPREAEIAPGTLVVVDWGARLDGYCSDCTRTYATGALDARDREVYDLVARAQEEALAAVREGAGTREVDAVARSIIAEAGHGEHFGHGLGHGVGLEVHEGPRLASQSEGVLAAGSIVTVEPGVYVPDTVGVRIEDLVVVRPDGSDVLSSLPKALTVVG